MPSFLADGNCMLAAYLEHQFDDSVDVLQAILAEIRVNTEKGEARVVTLLSPDRIAPASLSQLSDQTSRAFVSDEVTNVFQRLEK